MIRPAILSLGLLACPLIAHGQSPVDTASQSPMGDEVQHATKVATPSTTLKVMVPGHAALTFSLADLGKLPQVTLEVFNAHTKAKETYSGPLVSDVLAKAGLALGSATEHQLLSSYVVATGTDAYFVVYSGAELEPTLNKTQTIVAIAQAGKPLGRTGAFQLVDAADLKPARWVRNLQSLTLAPVQASNP